MPREEDSFRDHVKFLPNNKWKCNFCSKEYGGSVTRIKAHLAGVAGYGINDCKDVDGRVRSEARNALKGKGAAEPSNGAEGNVEEGPHLPVILNNEDAWTKLDLADMLWLSSDVTNAISSTVLPLPQTNLPETNLPSQGLLAQYMIPPFWPQQRQSPADDFSIQLWNISYPSSRPGLTPEALTDTPRPRNAEEGQPDTEDSQEKIPREKDPFRDHVKFLPNNKWKCNFCSKEYGGRVTRIRAHLAGVRGYGINDCKAVDGRVRSEARKAFNSKVAADWIKRSEGNVLRASFPHLMSSSHTQGPHQLESSLPATSFLSPDVISTLGVKSEEAEPNKEVSQGEMPKEMDPVWDHVEILHNNKWKCNFCSKEYQGSATMIKAHLAGVGGYGINDCKDVDGQVRSEALKMLNSEGAVEWSKGSEGNVRRSSSFHLISSSHTLGPHQPKSSLPPTSFLISDVISTLGVKSEEAEPNKEVPQGARIKVAPTENKPSSRDLANENMTALKRKLEEHVSNCKAVSSKWKKWKKKRTEEKGWSVVRAIEEEESLPSEKVAEVEKLGEEVEEILLVPGRLQQESTAFVKGCKRYPLVTTELVGGGTHQKIDEIHSYLMEDNISIIGIYGMAGVGKTAILMHLHNRLLTDLAFDYVLWVTAPQDFSMYVLQEEIANATGLDNLSKEKDVKRRAGILYAHLKMKRIVLILDGLWMHFEVKDVGIPVGMGSLKLILTTRSLDVCHMMLCQKQIKIELLSRQESWRLFLKTLCFAGQLPSEVEEIARSIVDKCEGLPLGIIEIATRMRGVEKVHKWKGMLRESEDSRMGLNVFKQLKLSYLNLGDHQVQQCFLHLILCFGDLSEINREDLIESFIDEGFLGGFATRQELHDRGNIILDKIRNACLLDDSEEEYQFLHPLTRDMALQIVMSATHMVKAYMGLKEIPEEVFWTDLLEKVFLQGNQIEEIPYGISPNCPKLIRLSLNDNVMLGVIHQSFFRHLKQLKVLNLSNTGIRELPDAISHLESLEALLLRSCGALHSIPPVRKLGSLRKLDLQGCASLEEGPEGMEMLVNLRYLNLADTEIETLPEGVLGKLVKLQYLAIKKVRAGEGANLKKLEALACSVPDVETFNAFVRFLEQNSSRQYRLAMDAPCYCESETERLVFIDSCDNITVSVDGTSGDGSAMLPKSVQSLGVSRCHKMKRVMECEWLITRLPNLREIAIYDCEKLEEIISGPLPSGATCHLTYLGVNGCNNMKRVLLTQDMLLHLPFLQEISVEDCRGIEVIIGTVANMTHASFPKLINLGLWNLPELKSICDGTMSCDSLRWITIENCPKLKRIPLQLPLCDNGLPCRPASLEEIRISQQTWELLEWDHPLTPPSLEPFVKFLWADLSEEQIVDRN